MGMFANRLRKNLKHMRKWAKQNDITSFRVYQNDIPEYPVIVDSYGDMVVAWAAKRKRDETIEQRSDFARDVENEIAEAFETSSDKIFMKERQPGGQYRRQPAHSITQESSDVVPDRNAGRIYTVTENGHKFLVNLSDYHDTGLFLDHRNTRKMAANLAEGKTMLNLFCYTGSFTVYAAGAGALETTSVDMSPRYLEWVRRNMMTNGHMDCGYDGEQHLLVQADVNVWLEKACWHGCRFDLIVCDPPTFSNSKRMDGVFDVVEDHPKLIEMCLELLNPGGSLFFSTNSKRFVLKEQNYLQSVCREITHETVPYDFKNYNPHRCWLFEKKRMKILHNKLAVNS